MKVRYINQQDESDPMNGTVITESSKLAELLEERRNSVPFLAELSASNGYELMFGLGCGVGCAQYSRSDGEPPYLLAVPAQRRSKSKYVGFLMNNTLTEFPSRYILNFDEVKKIAIHFLETGERSDAFAWEPI